MTAKRLLVLAALLAFAAPPGLDAQTPVTRAQLRPPDSGYVQVLRLRDGSQHIGRIREVTDSAITFETNVATIRIPIANIRSLDETPESRLRGGQYWFPTPQASRLFFAPTARMLAAGEGYFADHWLFFPSVAFGVTDRVTIGGGMSIFPGTDLGNQFMFLTPKVGLPSPPGLQLAAGALVIRVPEEGPESFLTGILYGVGTVGREDASLTIGLGYGFVESDVANRPMVMVGADARISRRVALVTENWILPGVEEPIVSYGLRIMGEKLSVDIAFVTWLGEDMLFPGIPLLGAAVGF
ncbi:MAG TPA: hypothetical protein VNL98_04975 [Gemmatimonadales bacterium]|nr:hypothetical protein [Gemmatimonadales bacterium]